MNRDNEAPAPVASGSRFWRSSLRLSGILLGCWFGVTCTACYFARDLSFPFFKWPFSWWFASQGALLLFLAIIAYYAIAMERLEDQAGADDDA